MKENTKLRILETGAEIIHLRGFNHTGIQEILDAAKIPKGSFYNYFKSKEDFGLQVIDHFVAYFDLMISGTLANDSLTPLEKIRNILGAFIELFKSNGYSCGCPIGNLSQEMGDLNPAFREKLEKAIDAMADQYSKLLQEAKLGGEISSDLDVRETAYFIVSSWHGALVRMKITKDPGPLENHMRYIFDYVLRPRYPEQER